MCAKLLAKRLYAGGRITATSSRMPSSTCSTLRPSPWVACSSKSKRENSSWRTIIIPDWKFFAASIFSSRSCGSATPVS